MSEESSELQIVTKPNIRGDEVPYGIRNRSGYLFFFSELHKFEGQEERYQADLEGKRSLAKRLLGFLES